MKCHIIKLFNFQVLIRGKNGFVKYLKIQLNINVNTIFSWIKSLCKLFKMIAKMLNFFAALSSTFKFIT